MISRSNSETESVQPGSLRDLGARQPLISVIVPAHNAAAFLGRCLAALFASRYRRFECLVVDDSSTDDTEEIAARYPVRILSLKGGPHGPAVARNRAAQVAEGDVLFFVDADVLIHPQVLGRIADAMSRSPGVAAVFGSYDESPESADFVSQYRNLLHHFVHQQGSEEGSTFWSGCGAIRRSTFLEMGGFDERSYPRPSIEDIELGYRLKAAGHRIMLDKQMLAKHLKAWTLRSMLRVDIFDRGIPWTLLILRDRNLPNDLNLGRSQRFSAFLLMLMLPLLTIAAFFHNIAVVPLLGALFFLTVGNWYWPDGIRLFGSRRRAHTLAYMVLAAIGGVSIVTGETAIIIPLIPTVIGVVVARWLSDSAGIWNRTLFTAIVVGQISAIGVVLAGAPVWLVIPLLIIPIVIVILNRRLYSYMARKRGVMFSLSVVPFQLLYYLYSTLAFVAGAGLYLWRYRFIGPSIQQSLGRSGDLSDPGRRQ